MKKKIAFILCLVMLLSLSACGGTAEHLNAASTKYPKAVSLQNSELQATLNTGGYLCQAPGGFYFTDNRVGIFRFDKNGTNVALVRPGLYYSIVFNDDYIYSVKSLSYKTAGLVRISVKDYSEDLLLEDIPFCFIKNIIDDKLYMASNSGSVIVYDIGTQSILDSFQLSGATAVSESGYYIISDDGVLSGIKLADNSQFDFDQFSDYFVTKIYFEHKGYLLMSMYNDFGEYLCSLNLETGEYNLLQTESGFIAGVGLFGYGDMDEIYVMYNNYAYTGSSYRAEIVRTDLQLQNTQDSFSSEFSDGLAILDNTLLAPNINKGVCRVLTLMGESMSDMVDLEVKFPTSLDNIYGDCEEETEILDMHRVYEALRKNKVYTYVDDDQSVCTATVYEDGRIDFSVDYPSGQKDEWSTTWTLAGSYYDLLEPDTLEDPVQILWDFTGDKFLVCLNSILTFVSEDSNPRFEGSWTNFNGDTLEITRTTMHSSGSGNDRVLGYINITENIMMLYENNEYGRLDNYYGPVAYVMINASGDGKLLGIAYDYTRPGYDEYDSTLSDCVVDAWTAIK